MVISRSGVTGRHGAAVADGPDLCGSVGKTRRSAALCELAAHDVRVLEAQVPERDIARTRLARGFLRGILARIEVTGGLMRDGHGALGDPARKERHRSDEVARQQSNVGIDIGHGGEARQGKTIGASSRGHIGGTLEHQHHVEDHEQRSPGG